MKNLNIAIDCRTKECGCCEHVQRIGVGYSAVCAVFGYEVAPKMAGDYIETWNRLPECLQAEVKERYSVTVSRDGDHLIDEQNQTLEFLTFHDAIEYLSRHDYTLQDILSCEFSIEAIQETV